MEQEDYRKRERVEQLMEIAALRIEHYGRQLVFDVKNEADSQSMHQKINEVKEESKKLRKRVRKLQRIKLDEQE